jgi:cardiolipin synthase
MWLGLLIAVWVAGWLCIPHLLLLNKRPTATLAWLWAIILFPVFGAVFYLAIGSERVKRQRRERRQEFRAAGRMVSGRDETGEAAALRADEAALAPGERALLRGLGAITQLPLATASALEILYKGEAFYSALRTAIQGAQREVHVDSYIWRDDEVGAEFLDLLVATAKRGVTVRLLLDELGCHELRDRYFRPLIAAGGHFSWCHTLSPLRGRYSFNLRNHRKLQIIDGRIAFVGGMNIGREYLGRDPALGDWSDMQLRVEGRVVEVFRQIFAEDWFFATGQEDLLDRNGFDPGPGGDILAQVLRGGPDEEDHPMLRAMVLLVATAKKRLWIATGYFVPGETMQTALQVAAARGVDVRLLVSSKSQHPHLVLVGRSYYDALLRQGVRIFEYDRGIDHSKYMVLDDDWATVGSSNFDERSLRLNFELSLLMRHAGVNEHLAGIFNASTARSHEIDRAEFARRPLRQRLVESALRPLSPVL